MEPTGLKILCLTMIGIIALGISAVLADELEPFIGHWEDNEYNCTVNHTIRNSGSYIVFDRLENSEDVALLLSGDHEAEGRGCNLRNPVVVGRKVAFDAMCGFEEFDPSPTQFELSLVYDDEHIAVLDKESSTPHYYTLCSRDPDSWLVDPEPGPDTHTTGTLNPPDFFWWLAEAFCAQEYNADSQFVRSGDCVQKVEDCKNDSNMNGCPSFQSCEYWRNGELISESACGLATQTSIIGKRSSWIWQNGNRVTINFNIKNNEPKWGGKKVIVSNPSGDQTCYTLEASAEKFCAMPHEFFFE
jgi:hypothetical protein